MTPGPRTHKRASLRVAISTGLPEEMRDGIREIVSLASEDRGKGHARALMYQVCAEADRAGIVLLLTVDTPANHVVSSAELGQIIAAEFEDSVINGGLCLTPAQLEKFYAKFGFVRVQSEPVVLMARQAQPLRIVRAA